MENGVKRTTRLFIEELEERKTSSPLFVPPVGTLPVPPPTMALWESGCGPLPPDRVTTVALGEEGCCAIPTGGIRLTTLAIGEECGVLK